MRTDNPTSGASAIVRLRAQLNRGRRAFAAQAPLVRWSVGLASVAGLLLVASSATPVAPTVVNLRAGQRFSLDEISKITRALEAKHIPFRLDEPGRRVEVESDHLSEATDLVSTLDIGPHALDDILSESSKSTVLEGMTEKQQRVLQGRNKMLGAMIRRFPDSGIASALVEIQRRTGRGGLRPATSATAFVYLQTEDDRPISDQTVQKIQSLIVGAEPEVLRNAVTVFDQTGRHYLDASNPTVGLRSLTRSREEDFVAKLLKELDHIKGVRVTVQLAPPPAPTPPPPSAVPPPPPPPAEEIGLPVVANQPVELEPEPMSKPPLPAPQPPQPASAPTPEPARVWVKVPSSFYLKMKPNREPSSDELRQAAEKTEKQIKTAVELVIPRGEFGTPQVTIDTIPDHQDAKPAPLPSVVPESMRVPSWWVVGGSSGAAAVMLLLVGLRVAAARRPAARPAPAAEFGRYTKVDAGSERGPGPSERVRELIRLNPEAAASVLQRWTGQGGSIE